MCTSNTHVVSCRVLSNSELDVYMIYHVWYSVSHELWGRFEYLAEYCRVFCTNNVLSIIHYISHRHLTQDFDALNSEFVTRISHGHLPQSSWLTEFHTWYITEASNSEFVTHWDAFNSHRPLTQSWSMIYHICIYLRVRDSYITQASNSELVTHWISCVNLTNTYVCLYIT